MKKTRKELLKEELLRKELLYSQNPADYLLLEIQIIYLKLNGKIKS
jgi:hypothetical protein